MIKQILSKREEKRINKITEEKKGEDAEENKEKGIWCSGWCGEWSGGRRLGEER
jgi:hypothetical protein